MPFGHTFQQFLTVLLNPLAKYHPLCFVMREHFQYLFHFFTPYANIISYTGLLCKP